MKKILICFFMLGSVNAWSHCLDVYYTPISEKKWVEKNCYVSEKLELGEKEVFYPNLSQNPRRVKYWKGKYSKIVAIEQEYLREMVNICNGTVISKKIIKESSSYKIDFSVYNPNLDPSINKSFLLVPMTNEEALTEMEIAKINCHKD